MFIALLTNAVSAIVENARATIFLPKPSRIAQQYTSPSRAGWSVMSPWPWQPGHAPLPHDRLDELVVDDHLVFFQQRLDGIGHDETTHLTGRHRASAVEPVGRPVQAGDPAR
jgi:hypothetical protein